MSLTSNGNLTDLADTGYTMADLQRFFDNLAASTGAKVEAGDVQALANKLMGETGFIRQLGGNPQGAFDLFTQQYQRRGSSGQEGSGIDSTALNTGSARAVDPSYAATVLAQAFPQAPPPSIAGNIATIGPAAYAPSGTATGPTGLLVAPQTYTPASSGGLFAPAAGGGLSTTTWLVLAAAAGAVYFFVIRRK